MGAGSVSVLDGSGQEALVNNFTGLNLF